MENVFGDIPDEGTEPVEEVEKETPTTTPVEEKPVVEEPAKEGENTPSEEDDNDYKDRTSKRVKQLLADRAEERTKREALEERLAKLEAGIPQKEEAIPERWSELFSTGDPKQDKEAYQIWKTLNQEEKTAWKAEVMAELRAEQSQETEEAEQQTALYESQMEELEETLGRTFDHNELMKAMAERPVWLTNGQPDWETKLELIEAKRPASNMVARKKLASIKPQSTVGTKGFTTPADLKGGWGSL